MEQPTDMDHPEMVPLELIRKAEAGCRRRLAAARAAAENELEKAGHAADAAVQAARLAGRQEGESQVEQTLEETQREVETIRAEALRKAGAIRAADRGRLAEAVKKSIDLVLENSAWEAGP